MAALSTPPERPYRVAVVGTGPKAIAALQRLLFRLHRRDRNAALPVEVDLYDRSGGRFSQSPIYGKNQPSFLLLNYALSNVDIWTRELRQSGVISDTPTLMEWVRAGALPHASPNDFVSRSLVGPYLQECLDKTLHELARFARVRLVSGTVTRVANAAQDSYRVHYLNDGTRKYASGYNSILLTTGHSFRPPQSRVLERANDIGSFYQDFSVLDHIPPGARVAVRGMGLTLFDLVLSLTEGRGGAFKRTSKGLVYIPSGQEPACIIPYSRSGRLMLPRPPQDPLRKPNSAPPVGKSQLQKWGNINFETVFWPSLAKAYEKLGVPGPQWNPSHRQSLPPPARQHDRLVNELCSDLAAIRAGHSRSRRAEVWIDAVSSFREAYTLGGLAPESHAQFDSHWAGHLARISFGPPAETAEKLLILAQQGLVHLGYSANPDVSCVRRGYHLASGNSQVSCSHHVNATIPNCRELNQLSPIVTELLNEGLGRLFSNGGYQPGCLEIDLQGRLIGANGQPSPIYLYGKPTEGSFFDNDSLSPEVNDTASFWASHCVDQTTRTPLCTKAPRT